MKKSKVITLPTEAVTTLWQEGSQMCLGIAAPGLPKGLRLSTKASGYAGKELGAYHQKAAAGAHHRRAEGRRDPRHRVRRGRRSAALGRQGRDRCPGLHPQPLS